MLLFVRQVVRNGEAWAKFFLDAAETIVRDCGLTRPARNCGIVFGENAFVSIVQEGQALVERVLTWQGEKMPQLSTIASPVVAPFHV